MLNTITYQTDICVVGGGMAGLSAAISAARAGSKVVLMQERPMLGGNASSEIRMWICGAAGENNRETGLLEEISLENYYRNPTKSYAIWDSVLYDFIKREPNINLLLNCTCINAETKQGTYFAGRTTEIKSITGYSMTTQQFYKIEANYFIDCSGDSILAPLTGAEFKIGRESADEFGEDTHVKTSDNMTMGMSCLIEARETDRPVKFIPPKWATSLEKEHFERRNPDLTNPYENFWYLELGGNQDTIRDTDKIRDELISLALGTWDYLKNKCNGIYDNWDLDFLGFLPGKRESRRMTGEYVITQNDIFGRKIFADIIAYGGWPLDDHFPAGFYHKGIPNTNIKTPAPYGIPYRALYSKNVNNLLFAGRNISMTHMAMSSIRVMATCALLGQAAGFAAHLCSQNKLSPHGMFLNLLEQLQDLLLDHDCFLPGKKRKISSICRSAELNVKGEFLRNGIDREHELYYNVGTIEAMKNNQPIVYKLNQPEYINSVHLVFDSDLNRTTLPGHVSERIHSMRANTPLNAPPMHLPLTLCKSFVLLGEDRQGNLLTLYHETNNRRRAVTIKVQNTIKEVRLVMLENWGGTDKTKLISFDFE